MFFTKTLMNGDQIYSYLLKLKLNLLKLKLRFGYNSNVLQQAACLVVNPITVGNFAFLFNCTPVGRTSDSMTVLTLRLIY